MIRENKHLEMALSFYGLKEWKGDASNPEVEALFKELGYNYTDDIAWCSTFMNVVFKKCGMEYTGKLNAKSWLKIGGKISKGIQIQGDVMIFHRGDPKSWKGHVAMYISEDDHYYYVLGGNQGNMVNISAYSKRRLAGIRRIG